MIIVVHGTVSVVDRVYCFADCSEDAVGRTRSSLALGAAATGNSRIRCAQHNVDPATVTTVRHTNSIVLT